MSGRDVGDESQAGLEAWLQEPLPDFEELTIGREHKWLASSALQKSIRRGRVAVALEMANALIRLDPAYLPRRLRVIALEDVAVGNLDAAEATIWALKNAAWRRRVGGTARVVRKLVERLASGVKDRTSCDAIVAVDWDPALAPVRRELARLDERDLIRRAVEDPDPLVRVACCWQLAGPERGGSGGMKPGKARPNFEAVVEATAPSDRIATIMRTSWRRGTGALAVGLGAVAAMAEAGASIEREEFEQLPAVGSWPSEAIDTHTREGQMALAYLAKAAPTLARLLRSGGVAQNRVREALGELLWAVETDRLDRRLAFPGSVEIRRQARRAQLAWLGLRDEFHEPAIRALRANLPLLDHARRRIMNVVGPGGPREVITPAVRELLRE